MREVDPRAFTVQAEQQTIWRQHAVYEPGAGSHSKCSPEADCIAVAAGFSRELANGTVFVHSANMHGFEHGGRLQVQEGQHMTLC